MQLVGKVLWWDKRDREGVIVDANGTEVYFNSSIFSANTKLTNLEGKFVWFTLNKFIRHVLCAETVATVPNSSVSKARKSFEQNDKRNNIVVAA